MTAPAEEPGARPEFTEEEIGLIRLWARSDASAGRQLGVLLAWSMITTYLDRRKYTLMQSICRKILPGGMEK